MDKKTLESNEVILIDDYFVHRSLLPDDYKLLLSIQKTKPRYVPSKRLIERYAYYDFLEETKEVKALENYLKNQFLTIAQVMDCVREIHWLARYEYGVDRLLKVLENHQVMITTEQELKAVVDLIVPLKNNVRLWVNNGFTPRGLREFLMRK
ncbi:hypothetical protein [Liberiplasma polymorphum]|uniref:hypothetical protein n=1 Tax=Liberiplasma polymorphum TaxID=3374570 RepID=UPI00377080DC